MKVLVVEDNESYVEIFRDELSSPDYDLTIAMSRASALLALSESYELIVCDLKIPSTDGALDADTSHGMAVLTEVIRSYPGTPTVVFSAFATVPIMQELLAQGRHGDYLGVGEQHELLKFLQKDQLSTCLEYINEMRRAFADLEDIELSTGGAELGLTEDEERVVRLFARRTRGTLVHLKPLDGGRSGARVLSLRVDSNEGRLASVVAKVGEIEAVQDEKTRIDTYVVGALPVGAFPAVASVIEVGAGRTGGIFFQVAGFDNHLLDLVISDVSSAGACVAQIQTNMRGWRDGVGIQRMAVADIRRLVVEDAALRPEQSSAINEDAESKLVHVRWCMQHNDLHVFNILVGNDGDAIVIDFANVGSAPAALDPVTLELSVAFHEAAYSRFGSWPTEESAAVWSNLDEYLVGCPYADFVKACREWAHSTGAGDGEVWASVYAYTIGQLRFDTCPRSFATRLLEHVSEKLIAL